MVNSILCAIDFTEFSVSVIKHAVSVACKLQVPLNIIFSYRLTEYKGVENVVELKSKIEKRAKNEFTKIEQEVLSNNLVNYHFLIEVGFLTDRIEHHVKRDRNTMLVIGESLANSMNEMRHDHFFENLDIPVEYVADVNSAA